MDCTIVDIPNERGSYLHNSACERLQVTVALHKEALSVETLL